MATTSGFPQAEKCRTLSAWVEEYGIPPERHEAFYAGATAALSTLMYKSPGDGRRLPEIAVDMLEEAMKWQSGRDVAHG